MKNIYSLNLISYLHSKGIKEIRLERNQQTGKVYYVFPESREVNQALREYKDPDVVVVLHDFVENFKNIKKEIYHFIRNDEAKND